MHKFYLDKFALILAVCEFSRHELPVTAEPIEILADTSELLVVNKPSSIPIHPCGRYRFNCLLYVLAKEKGFRNLRGKLLKTFCDVTFSCAVTLHPLLFETTFLYFFHRCYIFM